MTDPSIQQLRSLVALADTLHFGQAADECGVSQPALSAQLTKLEETLQVQLVERTTRKVMFTAAGNEMLGFARNAVDQVDLMIEATRQASSPMTGPIRLGVIPTIAPYLLPPVLAKLRIKYPGLRVLLHEQQTFRLIESLQRGEVDMALLALPVEAPGILTTKIGDEKFELVAPSSHRLAGRKAVSHRDLADEEVLLLEDGHCLRDQALDVCGLAGARETASVRANSISTLVQMVANGLGITLLPESAVKTEVRAVRDVKAIPFRGSVPTRSLGLAVRKSFQRADEVKILSALLTKELV